MKLHPLLYALALAAGSAVAAHAQGAVYVTPVFDRISVANPDNNPTFSFLGTNTTSRMFYGVQFGGYYNFPLENKQFQVGLDLRDSVSHGNNALLNTFLGGPRIGITLESHPRLHPYVEPFIGVGSTRAPYTTVKINKPQYGGFVGADYDLSKRVGFRIVEVGYSALTTVGSGTVGATGSQSTAGVLHIATGLTLRLP